MKDFYRPFENKAEKEEYLLISRLLWGGSPLDIDWAKNTPIYKGAKQEYDKLTEKDFYKLAIALNKIRVESKMENNVNKVWRSGLYFLALFVSIMFFMFGIFTNLWYSVIAIAVVVLLYKFRFKILKNDKNNGT